MSTIQQIYQQAELAEAAYSIFFDENGELFIDAEKIKAALQNGGKGMSKSQAAAFLTRWTIIDQYTAPSSLFGQTGTGFSATLFKSTDTGQYTFAIRGTEPGYPDLLGADFGDLVMDGLPLDQTIEMYNYWQRLTHPDSYLAAKLEESVLETAALKLLVRPAYVAAVALLQSDGAIIDTTPGGTVVRRVVLDNSATLYAGTEMAIGLGKLRSTLGVLNVTGHSLGGNLAAAFTRLFPSINAQAITINGAGFPTGYVNGGSLINAAANIHNLFSKLGGADAFDATRIQNVVGDGAKMVSMDSQYGLVQPGKPQLEIFLEKHFDADEWNGDYTLGHGVTQMVDSLALYDLFARLDPVLGASAAQANLDKITGILKAASSEAGNSLETTLDAIRTLFETNRLEGTPEGRAPATGSDRESLYKNLVALDKTLKETLGNPVFTLETTVDQTAAQIAANAAGDLAWRYALYKLNPFVLSGSSATYAAINATGQLDLYALHAAASGEDEGGLTTEWIADRAALLTWKNRLGTEDADVTESYTDGPDAFFDDRINGLRIEVGARLTQVADKPHYVFGKNQAEGMEILQGGNLRDRLYGGAGNDLLTTGADNDYLEGGLGADTLEGGYGHDLYRAGAGDTIRDSGGQGKVLYGTGVLGIASRRAGEADYIDAAGSIAARSAEGWFLIGGSGGNVLTGNGGSDVLHGGAGNDTYLFGIDAGSDKNPAKSDVVQLRAGVTPGDVGAMRKNNDRQLLLANGQDALTVMNLLAYVDGRSPYGTEAGNECLQAKRMERKAA